MSSYEKQINQPVLDKDRLIIALIRKASASPEGFEFQTKAGTSFRMSFYTFKRKLLRLQEKAYVQGGIFVDEEILQQMDKLTIQVDGERVIVNQTLLSGAFGDLAESLGGLEEGLAAGKTKEDEESEARQKTLLELSANPEEPSELVKAYRGT